MIKVNMEAFKRLNFAKNLVKSFKSIIFTCIRSLVAVRMTEVEAELEEIERKMTDLEKDREDRSKRIMDRRVLQVTTLQELGKPEYFVIN